MATRVTERVRELAREQGITYRELARRLGRSHTWIQNRFSGEQAYDLSDLDSIGDVLGAPVEDLLGMGAYGPAPEFLPPEIQRLAGQFTASVMAHYSREDVTPAERRALLKIVREAWRYVERGMAYWAQEVARETVREPAMNRKSGGQPKRKQSRP